MGSVQTLEEIASVSAVSIQKSDLPATLFKNGVAYRYFLKTYKGRANENAINHRLRKKKNNNLISKTIR